MGQSTSAILFFGYDLGDDEERDDLLWNGVEDGDDVDWEEFYAEKKGLPMPKHLFGLDEFTDEQSAEYDEYYKKKREIAKSAGVEVGTHCSCDHPMTYIYTRQYIAHRGFGRVVDPAELAVTEEEVARLREFCEFMGIDVGDEEPEWHLVSDWC